jgi:TRAP-type C4-dicarboxylate transport system substrate-binding protein
LKRLFAMALCLFAAGPASAQVTLSLTTMSPPGSDFSAGFFRPWAERVNASAGGTVTVDPRDGYAIANYGNVYDRVTQDVVQIGWGMQGIIAGKFPLTEIATFPFEADNAEQASTALWKLYRAGDFGDEYKGLKLVLLGTFPMNGVHYAKKPPTLDNFKGLKVRAASKPQSDWIERLDGAPISMPPEDLYTALERGTIDVTLQGWSTFGPIKLADVTSYHVDAAFGTSTVMIFMIRFPACHSPEGHRRQFGRGNEPGLGKILRRACATSARYRVGPSQSNRRQAERGTGKFLETAGAAGRRSLDKIASAWRRAAATLSRVPRGCESGTLSRGGNDEFLATLPAESVVCRGRMRGTLSGRGAAGAHHFE